MTEPTGFPVTSAVRRVAALLLLVIVAACASAGTIAVAGLAYPRLTYRASGTTETTTLKWIATARNPGEERARAARFDRQKLVALDRAWSISLHPNADRDVDRWVVRRRRDQHACPLHQTSEAPSRHAADASTGYLLQHGPH